MKNEKLPVRPAGYWGRRPYFSAKIGTMSSSMVLVKGARRFERTWFAVGDSILFCDVQSLRGMTTGCTPVWVSGRIWLLEGEDGRLFIQKI